MKSLTVRMDTTGVSTRTMTEKRCLFCFLGHLVICSPHALPPPPHTHTHTHISTTLPLFLKKNVGKGVGRREGGKGGQTRGKLLCCAYLNNINYIQLKYIITGKANLTSSRLILNNYVPTNYTVFVSVTVCDCFCRE